MATNEFLEFCPTDTGTNLLTEVEYTASTDRTSGNKPGIASAKLNNKALRQANFITSQFAQYLSDQSGTDTLDDGVNVKMLAQITAMMKPLAPVVTSYLSSTGSHNLTYYFFIAVGNATAAATYTNNGVTYTVKATVASGLIITASGSGAPEASGILTKTGGTGDATLTFYAYRAPISLDVDMNGGGGGSSGSGTAAGGTGGDGGDTTFGTTLLSAAGGKGGIWDNDPAAVATASLGSGPLGLALSGAQGQGGGGSGTGSSVQGGNGASTPFGGGGAGGNGGAIGTSVGSAGRANTGAGGGGAGCHGVNNNLSGSGGNAGATIKAFIAAPSGTYAYAVGAGGIAGTAGGSGLAGTAGGSGVILLRENFQ